MSKITSTKWIPTIYYMFVGPCPDQCTNLGCKLPCTNQIPIKGSGLCFECCDNCKEIAEQRRYEIYHEDELVSTSHLPTLLPELTLPFQIKRSTGKLVFATVINSHNYTSFVRNSSEGWKVNVTYSDDKYISEKTVFIDELIFENPTMNESIIQKLNDGIYSKII
jgi:hypothetical protein